MNKNKTLENDFAIYHWEDEIVVITFKKVSLKLDISKKIVSDGNEFTGNTVNPMLVDVRLINGSTKEALDFFDTEESKKGVSSTAILVGSFLSKFFANIFLRLNSYKNSIPTNIFSDRNEAIKWLKQTK